MSTEENVLGAIFDRIERLFGHGERNEKFQQQVLTHILKFERRIMGELENLQTAQAGLDAKVVTITGVANTAVALLKDNAAQMANLAAQLTAALANSAASLDPALQAVSKDLNDRATDLQADIDALAANLPAPTPAPAPAPADGSAPAPADGSPPADGSSPSPAPVVTPPADGSTPDGSVAHA